MSTDSCCISTGPVLGLVSIVIGVVAVLGMYLNAMLLLVLQKQKAHVSTSSRSCLTSMGLAFLFAVCSPMYRVATVIFGLLNGTRPAGSIVCGVVAAPLTIGGMANKVSLIGLALERWLEFRRGKAKASNIQVKKIAFSSRLFCDPFQVQGLYLKQFHQ